MPRLLSIVLAVLVQSAGAVHDTTRSQALRSESIEIKPQDASTSPLSRVQKFAHKALVRYSTLQDAAGAAAKQSLLGLRQKADPDAASTTSNAPATPSANGPGEDYGVDVSNITKGHTMTWGDKEHNVLGLPSWAAVLVGGASAALIVIMTTAIGNRLAVPLPFFPSEEQKLKHQIDQAREKVKILEAAVEAKREEERRQAEEEERKRAGEEKKKDGPTHDELVGELLYRTQEVQRTAVGAANDSLKQAAPLLARAAHVQNVFSESVAGVQERVSDLAIREAGGMYTKMRDALGMEDSDMQMLNALGAGGTGMNIPDWFKLDDENDLDPPPFALLLGGMFAPAQIKMTRGNCNSQIVWNSIILATCTACFIMDSHHDCPDKLVWFWVYGMLAINVVDVLCCSFIASRCAGALFTLQDDEDNMARIKKTGNSIWDIYIVLQANSGQFFKAYFAYQNVIDSPVYALQKLMSFISLFWGCAGMYVSVEDIVEDTLTCDAKIILWFMHVYSWFFLLFLTWTLIALMIWFLQKLAGFTFVTAPIMNYAKEADEEVPFQMPVFQTIARSFILRDSSTMLRIKARQVEHDCTYLETEVEEIKVKLQNRKQYLDQLEAKRQQAAAYEKKLIEKYKDKVREEGGKLPDDPVPGAAGEEGGSGSASSSAGVVRQNLPSESSQGRMIQTGAESVNAASMMFGAGPVFSGVAAPTQAEAAAAAAAGAEQAQAAFSSMGASMSQHMTGLQAQASAAYDQAASSAQAAASAQPGQAPATAASGRPSNPFGPDAAPAPTPGAPAPAPGGQQGGGQNPFDSTESY